MSSPTPPSSPRETRTRQIRSISETTKPTEKRSANNRSEDFSSLFEARGIDYDTAVGVVNETVQQTVKLAADKPHGATLAAGVIAEERDRFTTFNIGDSRFILVAKHPTDPKIFVTFDLTQDHDDHCERIKAELDLSPSYFFTSEVSGFIGRPDEGPRKTNPDIFSARFADIIERSPLAGQGFAPYDVIVTSDGILKVFESDYHLSFAASPVSLENMTVVADASGKRKISEVYAQKEGLVIAADFTSVARGYDDTSVTIINLETPGQIIVAAICDGHKGPRTKAEPNAAARILGENLEACTELTCLSRTRVLAPLSSPAAAQPASARPVPRNIFAATTDDEFDMAGLEIFSPLRSPSNPAPSDRGPARTVSIKRPLEFVRPAEEEKEKRLHPNRLLGGTDFAGATVTASAADVATSSDAAAGGSPQPYFVASLLGKDITHTIGN